MAPCGATGVTRPPGSPSEADGPSIDPRIERATSAFRDSLRSALEQIVPAGGDGARAIGRLLGTSRSTGWRCWRIAYSSDLAEILAALPGPRGLRSMLDGLRSTAVDPTRIESIEAAWSALAKAMRECRFDHASIRSLSASIRESAYSDVQASRLRHTAFRANAATFGIRTRLCFAAQLFVPSGDSIDLAATILHRGVMPLRPIDPVRIHTGIAPGSGPLTVPLGRPFTGDPRNAPLIEDACTPGTIGHAIVVSPEFPGEVDLEPAAFTGTPIDVAIGETLHAIGSPWATRGRDGSIDAETFMSMPIGVPTETLAMLVGIHRSLPIWRDFTLTARAAIVTKSSADPDGRGTPVSIDGSIESIPMPRPPRDHEDALGPITTMLERGAEAMGTSLDDFEFVLATVRFPLLASTIALRWRRPVR